MHPCDTKSQLDFNNKNAVTRLFARIATFTYPHPVPQDMSHGQHRGPKRHTYVHASASSSQTWHTGGGTMGEANKNKR